MKNLVIACMLAFSFCFVAGGCGGNTPEGDPQFIKKKADEAEVKPQDTDNNLQEAPAL